MCNSPAVVRDRVRSRRAAVVTGVVVIAFLIPSAASAARAPTYYERLYITRALGALQKTPAGCVYLDIRVSANASYAFVNPVWLVDLRSAKSDPCDRYASNGSILLRRVTPKRWVIVWGGSDRPPCSRHYPPDLIPCMRG
jgi:hypothetical protein